VFRPAEQIMQATLTPAHASVAPELTPSQLLRHSFDAMQNVPVTVTDLAALVWDAQHDSETLFIEADLQQRKALTAHIHDVLLIFVALGFLNPGPVCAGCVHLPRRAHYLIGDYLAVGHACRT
jgi:hypothetical protein